MLGKVSNPYSTGFFQYKKAFEIAHLPTTTKSYHWTTLPAHVLQLRPSRQTYTVTAHLRKLLPRSKDQHNFYHPPRWTTKPKMGCRAIAGSLRSKTFFFLCSRTTLTSSQPCLFRLSFSHCLRGTRGECPMCSLHEHDGEGRLNNSSISSNWN